MYASLPYAQSFGSTYRHERTEWGIMSMKINSWLSFNERPVSILFLGAELIPDFGIGGGNGNYKVRAGEGQ